MFAISIQLLLFLSCIVVGQTTMVRTRNDAPRIAQMVLSDHSGDIKCLAFSPDGRYLVSGADILYEKSGDRFYMSSGGFTTWNLATGQRRFGFGSGNAWGDIAFLPDGKTVVALSQIGLFFLNIQDGTKASRSRAWDGGAISPRGDIIAANNGSGIALWDIKTDQHLGDMNIPGSEIVTITKLAFHPGGNFIAGGSESRGLMIWSVSSKILVKKFATGASRINAVAFSPKGDILAGGFNNTIRLWSWESTKFKDLQGTSGTIYSLAFSGDGKLVASGSSDGRIAIWNAETTEIISRWTASPNEIFAIAFSPDGQIMATAGADRKIYLWSVKHQ